MKLHLFTWWVDIFLRWFYHSLNKLLSEDQSLQGQGTGVGNDMEIDRCRRRNKDERCSAINSPVALTNHRCSCRQEVITRYATGEIFKHSSHCFGDVFHDCSPVFISPPRLNSPTRDNFGCPVQLSRRYAQLTIHSYLHPHYCLHQHRH